MSDPAPSPPPASPPSERARQAALRSFVVKRLSRGFGIRTAFGLGIAVAGITAAWMLALFLASPVDAADVLLVRGIGWLCLVAGGVATVGLAADLVERDAADGVTALLEQRGHPAPRVRRAQLFATVRLIAGALLVPAIALALLAVALSRSLDILVGRLALTVGVAGYVLVLSAVLGACARWSVALDPRRARLIVVAILLGPELARSAGVEVPGIPSLFAELLTQMAALGVAFA